MTLLVVLFLTSTGQVEPQIYKLPSTEACLAIMPKAIELAMTHSKHGFSVSCVNVNGLPNA